MPVVGNTHELQNGRNPQREWFMKAAAKANPRIEGGHTAQGFYVMAADGTAYGFNNNRSVERVLAFAVEGLKAFAQSKPATVEVPPPTVIRPTPPQGASVLRVYSRIAPVPEGCAASNENVQRDHFWVLKGELGDAVSQALVRRLCRFALVDAIRGEPDFWRLSELVRTEFRVVTPGRLTGTFAMTTSDRKRGFEGTFEAEFAVREGTVSRFKGYAEGKAWGSGTYTPGAPEGKFPLKLAFVMAPEAKDTVAPQAAMFGREYLTGSP